MVCSIFLDVSIHMLRIFEDIALILVYRKLIIVCLVYWTFVRIYKQKIYTNTDNYI